MQVLDIAAKVITNHLKRSGKKLKKNTPAYTPEKAEVISLNGNGFRLGFSKACITPKWDGTQTYWIAGHGSGHKMEGILNDAYASALWIDCGNDEGVLWISADIIALSRNDTMLVRSMLADFSKEVGCKCINISCTHSHAGIDTLGYWGKANKLGVPENGKNKEYMDMLLNTIVKLCKEAHANRKTGKLYKGSAQMPGSFHDGRPERDKHEVLSRLRFVPEDNSNEVWIMSLGAHPNSLGGSNRLFSGEYPSYMRQEVAEKSAGTEVFFGIGAIGGMDMIHSDPDDRVKMIKHQGHLVAEAALGINNDKELTVEIKAIQQPFLVPVDNIVLSLLVKRGVMNYTIHPCEKSSLGMAMLTEMTYMEIGEQKIVFIPGESFVQTVYGGYCSAEESSNNKSCDSNPPSLADIAGDPDLIAFGVSNDMIGYIVPESEFLLHPTQPYLSKGKDRLGRSHYHETNSMGFQTQRVFADTFSSMINLINNSDKSKN